MPSDYGLLLRLNRSDRTALKELASIMQLNRSDVLRLLVRETLAAFRREDAQAPKMIESSGHELAGRAQ